MTAPDRIRLTDSLRKRPRMGPLLFGSPEDPRFTGLGPTVLDPDELLEAPVAEQLESLGIAGTVGVVQEEEPPGRHPLHRRSQNVDARHLRRLEEVHHDELE